MLKIIISLALVLGISANVYASPQLEEFVIKESEALLIDQFGVEALRSTESTKNGNFDIPWNQPGIQFWLQYYDKGINKLKLAQSLSRYSMFIPYIRPILQKEGLPETLLYLPIVESNGDPSARSKAGAAGLWQLMPKTARMYGLRVNRHIDERYDIEKSTKAAARYLKNLYKMFGKWELAIASYNAGPGKIQRLMKRTSSESFWDLTRLPFETLNYVPKFYAVAYLLNSNKIKHNSSVKLLKIRIMSKTSLYSIAKKLKVPYSVIKTYNRQYKQKTVPAKHYVYIPAFAIKNGRMLSKAETAKIYIYKPYKTEKVTRIAKRFGTDVKTVKMINRIKGKYAYKGQVLLIVASNYENSSLVVK